MLLAAVPAMNGFLCFAGQRIVNRLRTSLFSSVLRQEVAFFDKTRTGELINRLSSDTALLGRSVTENLSDGLRAGAQASVGVGMMVSCPLPGNLPSGGCMAQGTLLMHCPESYGDVRVALSCPDSLPTPLQNGY